MATSDSNTDMSDIKRLDSAKRQRKTLLSRVTMSFNETDKIIDNPDPSLSKLMTFVEMLEGIVTDLDEVNAIIQSSLSDYAFSKDEDECFQRKVAITNTIKTTKLII